MTEVFNNIRAECARKRMTIAEMTHSIGIERKTFYEWEKRGDISVAMLRKIAGVLDVSVEVLMKNACLKSSRLPNRTKPDRHTIKRGDFYEISDSD